MIGIYKIENIKNNKVYIGKSSNIENRWKQHIKELNKGEHHCIRLQYDYNKYKCTNFTFSILELCNKNEIKLKEEYYIDKYFKLLDGDIYNTQITINNNQKKVRHENCNNKDLYAYSELEYDNKTINSRRIINHILKLKDSNYYELTIVEMSKKFNISDSSLYRDYNKIVDDMNNIYINNTKVFNVFYEDGVFKINKNCKIKKFNSKYDSDKISKFKSNYSLKILNNILFNKNNLTLSLDEIRRYFNVFGNTYKKYSNIKYRIFVQIQKDFNNSGLTLEIKEIKKGRKVVSVQFKVI